MVEEKLFYTQPPSMTFWVMLGGLSERETSLELATSNLEGWRSTN